MSKTNKLYLFNPENDLALALGCRHYTPPPHASQLHRAGALLPAWWADENDGIIAPYPWAQKDAEWLKSRWGLSFGIGLPSAPYSPMPWGWSEDARRQFAIAGAEASTLPSDSTLHTLRQLSHRRSSITILSALGLDNLLPEEVNEPERALQLETERPGHYFKSPWSCSGRGVFCAQGLTPKVVLDKTAGIIHRQGSVMAELGYRKIAETGALFHSDGKKIRFRGLSMFLTEPRGAYTGNIIAPQDYFFSRIDSLGLLNELTDTTCRLEEILGRMLLPHYTGWLGIDMMVYEGDDRLPHLHPCIELNLRMTMGVAAMKIAERLSPTRPMLMGWQRMPMYKKDTPPSDQWTSTAGDILLPPREGFVLTISKFE